MKSTFHGNLPDLKGKKTRVLRCGCCVVQDRRDDVRAKEAAREMKPPTSDDDDEYEQFDGIGTVTLYERLPPESRRVKNNPIGFVHFPEKPARKRRKPKE